MNGCLELFYRFRAQRARVAAGRLWDRCDALYAKAVMLDARADALVWVREAFAIDPDARAAAIERRLAQMPKESM